MWPRKQTAIAEEYLRGFLLDGKRDFKIDPILPDKRTRRREKREREKFSSAVVHVNKCISADELFSLSLLTR